MAEQTERSQSNANEEAEGPIWLQIIWMVLRSLFVPVLLAAALIIGLMIGYAVIGKQPVSDVFQWNTWKHLYDLVFSNK